MDTASKNISAILKFSSLLIFSCHANAGISHASFTWCSGSSVNHYTWTQNDSGTDYILYDNIRQRVRFYGPNYNTNWTPYMVEPVYPNFLKTISDVANWSGMLEGLHTVNGEGGAEITIVNIWTDTSSQDYCYL